jgi:hypothetical protein
LISAITSLLQELYLGLPGCAWRLIAVLLVVILLLYSHGASLLSYVLLHIEEMESKPAPGLHTS